jgi:D-glycero-D-manno-heptose 1,7-bisphosphate phosphatase
LPQTVFLDRDGTINREVHHLRRVDQFELLDRAAEAIRLLNESGMRVVVVTNQAAIARGLLSVDGLDEIHTAMHTLLGRHGARVDAIYYCPHHPTEGVGAYRTECSCRKPRPGALKRAAHELQLDLENSFFVGDKRSDLEAGRAAGCGTILVRTGYGRATEAQLQEALQPRRAETQTVSAARGRPTEHNPSPSRTYHGLVDHVAENLLEAAQWILARNT